MNLFGRLVVVWLGWAAVARASDCTHEVPAKADRLTREEIQAAMQVEVSKGYNLLVSTNAGRFNSAVLLELARGESLDSTPQGFLLHHDDWYEAFRVCLGLDSAAVPAYVDLQRVHHQDRYVQRSPAGVKVEEGPTPLLIVHVTSGWPEGEGVATEYTFVDTAASPDMEVTNEHCISYWLVDYGDIVLNDCISGLRGRPLEGALGVAFKLVGSGRAQWSRSIVAPDGSLVTYSRAARGPFATNLVSTTFPSGLLVKGIPDDRSELRPLEERLKQPLRLEYPELR